MVVLGRGTGKGTHKGNRGHKEIFEVDEYVIMVIVVVVLHVYTYVKIYQLILYICAF